MQPTLSTRIPDGFMAEIWLGGEKPHQGVSSRNQAWHPAPNVCNSTTALGLRSGCAGNRVRSFCSGEQYDPDLGLYYLRARYYNPATGRFMSRDPEDGIPTDPKSLHKYDYAGGDPVNLSDPTGRATAALPMPGRTAAGGDLAEYGAIILNIAIRAIPAEVALACAIKISYAMDALKVAQYTNVVPAGLCSAKGKPPVCRPCSPVGAGEPGYRLDMRPSRPHFDKPSQSWINGPHWHMFTCNQSPPSAGCICSWMPTGIAASGTLPYGVDITTNACSGGGVE
jgi:RHS repeat-associated protein